PGNIELRHNGRLCFSFSHWTQQHTLMSMTARRLIKPFQNFSLHRRMSSRRQSIRLCLPTYFTGIPDYPRSGQPPHDVVSLYNWGPWARVFETNISDTIALPGCFVSTDQKYPAGVSGSKVPIAATYRSQRA